MTHTDADVASGEARADELFWKPGLAYMWALNDACEPDLLARHLEAYAGGDLSAVILHPRSGLLLPYGGEDWFDRMEWLIRACDERGLDVWLYDEDPFPSGSAGGLITATYPEYAARRMRPYVADDALEEGELFTFPLGRLLWAGLVDERTGETEDHTARVGVIRQEWKVLDPWDSRYYYPATPLYNCPRASANEPEYALRAPAPRPGMKLMAFVAHTIEDASHWGRVADSLNPEVTRHWIEMTHERYRQRIGDLFGSRVRAVFVDEPKAHDKYAYTPGMFEEFQQRFGYDLRPRLADLFSQDPGDRAVLTRLHYRQWIQQRFEAAWLEPVAEWCRSHRLALVGHISPEDDPAAQSDCVGNLFPLLKHFTLPGLDLIIPAVGDRAHGLVNIGVLSATSVAQQQGKPGVVTEDLACAGLDFTADQARRIVMWHALMGVNAPVVHCGYNSTEGNRLIDAPPDYGPDSERWPGMVEISRDLHAVHDVTRDATQTAPVAVLWPIRTFQAANDNWLKVDPPLRQALVDLLVSCLERQIGLQLLDEADLWQAQRHGRELVLGRARYTHVLIPPSWVMHHRSVEALKAFADAGGEVRSVGQQPTRAEYDHTLGELDLSWCANASSAETVESLPRLIDLQATAGDLAMIRCTQWQREDVTRKLIMNIGDSRFHGQLAGEALELEPNELRVLE